MAKNKNNKLLKEVVLQEDHTQYRISMTIEKSSIERLFRSVFLSPWRSKEVLKDHFLRHVMEELKEHIK